MYVIFEYLAYLALVLVFAVFVFVLALMLVTIREGAKLFAHAFQKIARIALQKLGDHSEPADLLEPDRRNLTSESPWPER